MGKQRDDGFDSEFGGKQRSHKQRKSQTSHGQREGRRSFDDGKRSTFNLMKRQIREQEINQEIEDLDY